MVVIRIVLSLIAAFTASLLVFLAIFVPMLIHDERIAPHDGQGGMSGFFVGFPIAILVGLVVAPCFYVWITRRGSFSNCGTTDINEI
jgi:hypothetical protein